ncbi:hypothetical protein [Actinomycetospora sp. NBRC 106378]|uniref:hypothetical protein n=1 Tax=Actinomycetospora sp. NBRC 106378 TaxID=3032208 RepID=UPI0024A05D97|nr:hypothetical protein [Actinomycetospora sp. NBRC 106378]GLZ51684.1 hypothetical protein Acsp07_13010 [Actinomycetospora sp. NBRC 106378]
MATWTDVRNYLHGNYRVDTDNGDFVKMLFHFQDGRSQFIYVRYAENNGGAGFATVESPIGELRKVDLVVLLREVEKLVCGGLSLVGGMVTLRHAVPLEDMSVEEFEYPLHAIAGSADELERRVSFVDAH